MNRTQKIDRCFGELVPEALKLMHEIHLFQGQELDTKINELRKFIREAVGNGKQIDMNDDQFFNILMEAVNAVGNYFDLTDIFETIKSKIPFNVLVVRDSNKNLSKDGEKIFAEFKKAVLSIYKHNGDYISNEDPQSKKLSDSIKIICNFLGNSESSIHMFSGDEQ